MMAMQQDLNSPPTVGTETQRPRRFWPVLIVGMAALCGGFLLIGHLAGSNETDRNLPIQLGRPNALGRQVYTECALCHQPGGAGVAGQYPPLTDNEWINGPAWRLRRILLNGLAGPITVQGKRYEGNMPPLKHFSDDELAAVLSYVRTNSLWGNHAEAVRSADFAATRALTAGRATTWSESELKALGSDDSAEAQPATTKATW